MRAYKLIRQMKDGTLRSLFIDKITERPIGKWLQAEDHPTKGYAERFGWHCTFLPVAPHLTTKGRVWAEVELDGEIEYKERPECQGGKWLLGKDRMRIIRILSDNECAFINAQEQDSHRVLSNLHIAKSR